MCAEYTPGQVRETEKVLEAAFALKLLLNEDWDGLKRIFPRDQAPIIRKDENGEYEMVSAEFSLIPKWWNPEKTDKKTKTGRPTFATHNARLESIGEKPTFRDSFQNKHCLVPIQNFFESSVFGSKFPGNRLKMTTGNILFAAGCYSDWINQLTGEIILSFTIITYLPSQQIFEAGHDRMPVFLDLKSATKWLNNEGDSREELSKFLQMHMINNEITLDISVDRILKEGWKKNAPDKEEVEELRSLIKKKA
jgi:putative SOS response-associated peptidase YedK